MELQNPMRERNQPEGSLVAEAPTIPTYRPHSQPSKRKYTISALAPKYQQYLSMADDLQPTDKSSSRTSNQNVTETVRYIQVNASSEEHPHSAGARDMFKAGQRRLKLAIRNKKGTDPKVKADDATRQLGALQQERYFPKSRYRKPAHKKSAASTGSLSKTISDLSFKSNSKRDVESIGRPWLENPLESRNAPGSKGSSQPSTLDLRDLASFVETAVNFSSQADNMNPSPYRAPTGQASEPTATATPVHEHIPRSVALPVLSTSTSPPKTEDTEQKGSYELSRPQLNGLTRSKTPNGQQNSNNQSLNKPGPKGVTSIATTNLATVSSATCSRSVSAPTTPVLKLFPDTMPPRMSSRGALRIPICRSPTPTQSLPPTPRSQKPTSLAAPFEPGNRDSVNSSNSLPRIHEDATDAREDKQHTPTDPERRLDNFPESDETAVIQVKHSRPPSSLPPGAIDAFPVPAPIGPLPKVPKPIPRIYGQESQRLLIHRPTDPIDSTQPDLEPPANVAPCINVSTPNSAGNSQRSSGRTSPFPVLTTDGSEVVAAQGGAPEATGLLQPRRNSSEKAARSREDKVRSLIFRDLAATKISSKHGKTESQSTENQQVHIASSYRGDQSQPRAHRHYQRKISPRPSLPIPMSPPPSAPPRHTPQDRRYGMNPKSAMAAAIENYENLSRPGPNSNTRVQRKNSIQDVETKRGRTSMEPNSHDDRAETPLPSSDDEGLAGSFCWNPPQRSSGRRRRAKPAPIIIDAPSPPRGRKLKKGTGTDDMSPPTRRGRGRHGPESAVHEHPTPHDYQTYYPHGYYTTESKPTSSLEGRIEYLERQNKILQAALLAALDVGVKQDLSNLLGVHAASSTTNTTPPLTGRSLSSITNTSTSEVQYTEQDRGSSDKMPYHPDRWFARPESFGEGSYDSEDSAEVRDLEAIHDFDLDWLSDRSSIMG
ncbi:uncharacterized protein BJX67DRAFT_165981 [Aspergillus lucknowensis]|uniref:Hap4 transcription factor heteromerisation domain-containing protein n=1 Tax=Aspergillus lucknowensis TaxID=176173 RepID=A0ABR4M4P4_9EURO